MNDVVTAFVGPSLRPGDIDDLTALAESKGKKLDVRPPVRRHDLLDLCDAGDCRAVVMLDGEFGQSLAVSIAEVRTVLEAGLRLHGSSSMGVLRAVECRTLGMTGSGWVYRQYLSGRIESDAEVALLFDPYGYEPVTIPLVNARWLIEEKVRGGHLSVQSGADAFKLAAGLNFRERRPSKLAALWQSQLESADWESLQPELAEESRDLWDRKRLDGIEALQTIMET